MARQFIHHEKKQGQLVCTCSDTLEEIISVGNDARIFDKIIDAIDMSSILNKYSAEGGKAYWPRILLKVLIYGYHKGIQSSRKLAFACTDSLSMKYLIGDLKSVMKQLRVFEFALNKSYRKSSKWLFS